MFELVALLGLAELVDGCDSDWLPIFSMDMLKSQVAE
jgi:hypothetical protein